MIRVKEYIFIWLRKLKQYSIFLEIFIIGYIASRFKGIGILTIIIILIGFAGMRLYINRDIFLYQMRELERSIWGKPLDREEWGKNEKLKRLKKIRKITKGNN